jgi:hypothetical protein
VLDSLDFSARLVIATTGIPPPTWTISTVEHVWRPLPICALVSLTQFADLRAIGQSTKVERSTVEQVRERIAALREKTKAASAAKAYDFDQRLADIREKEKALREQKKAEQKAAKEQARLEMIQDDNSEMAQLMGFGGFGTSKK